MKKNLKIYLMVVPSVIIIIAVIVSQIISIKKAFSDDREKSADSDLSIRFELNPEARKIEDKEDNLNTKVENYREGERKLKETESTEISFSSVFKNKEKETGRAQVQESQQTSTTSSTAQSQKVSKPEIPSLPSSRTTQTKEISTNVAKPENNTEPVSSMSVYLSQNAQSKETVKTNTVIQEYLDAVLEEDATIEHGGNVIFILSKTATIAGMTHKPGSILYGRATLAGDMFDILVYQIKSTDGKMYTCALSTYDENYNPGIRTGGEVNKAVRENANDAAIEQMDVSTPNNILNSAVKAAIKTANQAKTRKVTVSLRKGYKVHLKERSQ